MTEIHVEQSGESTYLVRIADDASQTEHLVTLDPEDAGRLGGGAPPEDLVRVSFEFLLEREPKESILRRFDLPVIGRYFGEYEEEMARRLGA